MYMYIIYICKCIYMFIYIYTYIYISYLSLVAKQVVKSDLESPLTRC